MKAFKEWWKDTDGYEKLLQINSLVACIGAVIYSGALLFYLLQMIGS